MTVSFKYCDIRWEKTSLAALNEPLLQLIWMSDFCLIIAARITVSQKIILHSKSRLNWAQFTLIKFGLDFES